jgi:hypothetical protein
MHILVWSACALRLLLLFTLHLLSLIAALQPLAAMHRSQCLSCKPRKMRCSCGFHTVHAMVAKISFNRQVVLNLEPAQATHDAHDDPM